MKSYPNSCIGSVDNGKIVVIGGSNSKGVLKSHAFIIDPKNKSATQLPSVPKGVKEGNLFEYKQYYYCVGGTVAADDPNSDITEIGSPIMRYNTVDGIWETFSHEEDIKQSMNKFLKKKIGEQGDQKENQPETTQNSLKNLISSGAFLFGQRIYFVGGKIFTEGSYQATDKIFSFGLEENLFNLREEPFILPTKLINPVCTAGSSNAIITGGKLESKIWNHEVFVIKFRDGTVAKSFAKLDSPLEENYPPSYLENEIIWFSFPKLWIRPKNADNINGFTFLKKQTGEKVKAPEILIRNMPENYEESKENNYKNRNKNKADEGIRLDIEDKNKSQVNNPKEENKMTGGKKPSSSNLVPENATGKT